MTRLLKFLFLAVATCICQTNLAQYIRIAGVAPDFIAILLVLLTAYTGTYGGFCTGAIVAMLYDASVGYVLAINLILYSLIGLASPVAREKLDQAWKILKHKSILVMMVICIGMTLGREIVYIGYLFLIGSEQSLVTLVRAILCSVYSGVLVWPCSWLVAWVMNWDMGRHTKERLTLDEQEEDRLS